MLPEIVTPSDREQVKVLRLPPALKVGELVKLSPDGMVYTVIRVTPCAAYIKAGDWTTEDGVLSGLDTGVEAVSLHAFVYREE